MQFFSVTYNMAESKMSGWGNITSWPEPGQGRTGSRHSHCDHGNYDP